MKIGIPRSLYYYYFGDFWIKFFEYLNIETIVSPETNKEILDLGLKYSVDEMCLSLKNYIGHVAYLKDKCDYILIPRIDNYGIDNQTCTNFLATYDIINNMFNVNILNYNINLNNNETEFKGFISMSNILNIDKNQIKKAYVYSKEECSKIRTKKILDNTKKLNSKNKKVLLVGHSYNIYDKFIGMPIISMLKKLNIEVIYSDLFLGGDESKKYADGLYWKYSKENISGISKAINNIDGIIFLSTFPCGLDSLVNELVMRKLDKPYINIILDDNSISGGIETRIESFIDIICANGNTL